MSSEDAIFACGLDGNIATWNRGAERLYGYSAEEIIGQAAARLVPTDRIENPWRENAHDHAHAADCQLATLRRPRHCCCLWEPHQPV